jgi:Tol biopolymer transport system component
MGRFFQFTLLISGIMLVALVLRLADMPRDRSTHLLYYLDGNALLQMNPDGSDQQLVLTNVAGDLVVSDSNHSWGLITGEDGNERSLYRIHPNNKLTHRIITLDKDEGTFNHVIWSADGEWIVFSTTPRDSKLFRMHSNGRHLEALLADSDLFPRYLWYFEGDWLVLNANHRTGGPSTYRFQLESGAIEQTPEPDYARRRLLSPNGRWIVFSSTGSGGEDLFRISADGMGLTQITTFPDTEFFQSWSPDSEWIYFSVRQDLYRLRWNGKNVQELTENASFVDFGLWSPDGIWMYFVGRTDSGSQLFRCRPNGDDLEQLTTVSSGEKTLLAWTTIPERTWNFTLLLIVAMVKIGGGLCLAYFNSRS